MLVDRPRRARVLISRPQKPDRASVNVPGSGIGFCTNTPSADKSSGGGNVVALAETCGESATNAR